MRTNFVLDALKQTLCACQPECNALVHDCNRGSQYMSIKYSERVAEACIELSLGSKGTVTKMLWPKLSTRATKLS